MQFPILPDPYQPKRPASSNVEWCPGCGNFGIRNILARTLGELGIAPHDAAIVSGIGQAAKMVHYVNVNGFHTLHGRSIPIATGLKIANPSLTVFAEGGDGDMYAEGANHLLHAIRRNPDITVMIHNNQVYGLTKGQASPTTMRGMKTPTQPWGVFEEPFNGMALAIAMGATFVARIYSGNVERSAEVLKEAISHRGLAIVEILHPCVSFNKLNTYQWYNEHTRWLEDHDPTDRVQAFEAAMEMDPLPLGILYKTVRPTFCEENPVRRRDSEPCWMQPISQDRVTLFLEERIL